MQADEDAIPSASTPPTRVQSPHLSPTPSPSHSVLSSPSSSPRGASASSSSSSSLAGVSPFIHHQWMASRRRQAASSPMSIPARVGSFSSYETMMSELGFNTSESSLAADDDAQMESAAAKAAAQYTAMLEMKENSDADLMRAAHSTAKGVSRPRVGSSADLVSVPWQPSQGWSSQPARPMDESSPLQHTQSSSHGATYCAVCMSDGADAFLLPCQHNFHARCILQWVESDHQQPQHRLSCPLCRQSIEQFVPIDSQIEDEDGDLLARFLKVWEKHYYQAPSPEPQNDQRPGHDEGDQLIKPTQTHYQYPEQAQQQQQIHVELSQMSDSTAPTPASSPFVLTGDATELTPEQQAWQQLIQDVFFIPDSLPDDFIIPSAHATPMTSPAPMAASAREALPAWDDHAANIAAIDGGRAESASDTGSGRVFDSPGNPFGLLSSFFTAFQGARAPLGAPPQLPILRAQSTPITPYAPEMRRLRHEARTHSNGTDETPLFHEENVILEEDAEAAAGATSPAPARPPHSVVPAPAFTPLVAGSIAGGAGTLVQQMTHAGSRVFPTSPLVASMPAIAAYFTSYEMMKAELGLNPSLNTDPRGDGVDPRAALFTPGTTGRYFAAASAAGAVSQAVKVALSPGVISLASAFASTAQISARMGIQFSVFEQAKNAFALYRHKRVGEELNAAEVLVAASLGGVVAASMMYPLQHLLPPQHWVLTAPPPTTPGTIGGAIPKPSLTACLGRFLPACVATAVTYEFCYRAIRNRTQGASASTSHLYHHHAAAASPMSPLLPAAVHPSEAESSSSSSESESPPIVITAENVSLAPPAAQHAYAVNTIADQTSAILSSVGVETPRDQILGHIPLPELRPARATTMSAHDAPPLHPPAASSSSSSSLSASAPRRSTSGSFGHTIPVLQLFPPQLLRPHSRGSASAHGSAPYPPVHPPVVTRSHATLHLPPAPSQPTLTRARSHPALTSLRFERTPPSTLDPW